MNAEALVGVVRDANTIPWLRIAAIAIGSWLVIRLTAWLIPRLADTLPAGVRMRLLPLVPAVRLVVTLIAVLWIVPLIIVPTPQNLVAVLGALGIAIGFAFKDYASSLVAGIVAVSERPYRQGDWVEIDGAYGEVRTVGLRAVEIVTPDDDVVTVPHAVLWTRPVRNANDGARTLQVVAELWVDPDHDAARLRERLMDVARTSPWLDARRECLVVVDDAPYGTRYRIRAYPLEARDQFALRSDLTVRAKEVVRAEGVGFASSAAVARADGRAPG